MRKLQFQSTVNLHQCNHLGWLIIPFKVVQTKAVAFMMSGGPAVDYGIEAMHTLDQFQQQGV